MFSLMTDLSREELIEEIKRLEAEKKVLSLQLQALRKEHFGSRSDKRPVEDSNQGKLPGIEEQAWSEAPAEEPKPPRKQARGRGKKKGPKPLNADLPQVDEQVPDPDLKDLICPVTGKPMQKGFTDTIEVLARKPAEYYVRRITRNVYVSAAGEAPVYSPWPRDVMSKSRIDTSVIANLLTGRFADHQPYHRQNTQLKRLGVELAPSTMVSLVRQACEKVQRLYESIIEHTLQSGYVQLDPTPIPLLSENKKGSIKQACMWTYRALDGPVFFEFHESKRGDTPARTLKGYTRILQTDGANNFGGTTSQPGVIHLECWAHARRYFVRAAEAGERQADPFLDHIDRLFRIERRARHFRLRPEKLRVLRQRHSQALVEAIFTRARDYAAEELLLKTPMPKAVNYLLGHEKGLRECFRHAPSRIDNNLAENALRPLKLGARNWLFVGSQNAGPRAAIMFTLVENCRLAKINPEAYFKDFLARIDDHPDSRIEELIPQNWAKLHHSAAN